MVWCGPYGINNPALCPAFRVRRGRRAKCCAMTRYAGSRASGYPPDCVSFRPRWDACRLRPPSNAKAFSAVLPFDSLVRILGNPRSRAGVPNPSNRKGQGIPEYEGKATPTRATLRQAPGGPRPVLSIASGNRARSWAIERTRLLPKSSFWRFAISDFAKIRISAKSILRFFGFANSANRKTGKRLNRAKKCVVAFSWLC
jgi:hypothetical protein